MQFPSAPNLAVPSVILVGGYPPPYGGNSAHIERLAYKLINDRIPVTVVDPYRSAITYLHSGKPTPNWVEMKRWELLQFLRKESPESVVHFHMSAGNKFYFTAPALLACTSQAFKRILTIHSGSWAKELGALRFIRKQLAVSTLRRFDDIICVNSNQKDILRGTVQSSLHILPAYLPPVPGDAEQLPDIVDVLQKEVDVVIATSGYGTPIYDYLTVIESLEVAQKRLSQTLGLIVATYASWDAGYWPRIVSRLEASEIPTAVTIDLTPSQFISALSKTRIYIRSTTTDGDAVAIREAAAVGNQVIASNSVPRVAGCALFNHGDVEDLSDLIVRAAGNRNIGTLSFKAHLDNYMKIRSIYEAA